MGDYDFLFLTREKNRRNNIILFSPIARRVQQLLVSE